MKIGARIIALLVFGMAIHLATLVLAQSSRVILIGPSPEHPLVARMRDELNVLGLEVEIEVAGAPGGDLAALGKKRGAAAVVRVEGSPPEIFLWVDPARSGGGDGAGGEIRVSESVQGSPSPGLLALRAVELLRGRLIQVPESARRDGGAADLDAASAGDAPADSAAPPPTAAPVQPPPRPPPSASAPAVMPISPAAARRRALEASGRLSLDLGAAVLLSPGGISAAPEVKIGAAYRFTSRLGVGAVGYIPTTASAVSSVEGDVDVRALDVGVDFRGVLTEPGASLELSAGIGISAMALFFSGEGVAPYVGASGVRWAAAPYGALGSTYRFTPHFGLRADILAALVRPEPVVRILGREVASFGEPAVFLSIGVEARP